MKILIALLAVALLAGAGLLVAIRTNGPAVLNALDRVTGGSRDVALVARTTYGEHPAQKLRIYAPADAAASLLHRVTAASCFVMGNAQGSPMLPRARVHSLHQFASNFSRSLLVPYR